MRPALPLVALVTLCSFSALADRPYRGGAVASAYPQAAQAGKAMLDRGGNAVDAAVAAAFVAAVVAPYHSGLGGGGFAVVHDVVKGDATLDFREVAPGKVSRDLYVRNGKVVPELATDGALSVAVPGAVRGYLELQATYGKLTRAQVLAPAVALAKGGFVVTPKYRDLAQLRLACLQRDTEAARLFLRPGPDGVPTVPALGATLTQPELAATLVALSQKGAASFYEGPLAKALVDAVQAKGGLLTLEDLKAYRTHARAPLEGSYRGHRVLTMPPPSAGGVALLQVMGMLEATKSSGPALRDPGDLHVFLESVRRAYVDRAKYLGDPDFTPVPLEQLLSAPHLAELASTIVKGKATSSLSLLPAELRGPTRPEQKNTTHISVVDREGNAVALTTTVNFAFGSCLAARGTGVLLNDEMDDFASQPGVPNVYGLVTGEANAIGPGKRPLSSMTPTLVFQAGRPTEVMLAVGSPGGSTIPTTVMQVLSAVVDAKLDVVRAVGLGRVHHQWLPDEVWVDKVGLEPATAKALEAMGHTLVRVDTWGDAEAVLVDPVTGWRTAGSDPRNEGLPAGQE